MFLDSRPLNDRIFRPHTKCNGFEEAILDLRQGVSSPLISTVIFDLPVRVQTQGDSEEVLGWPRYSTITVLLYLHPDAQSLLLPPKKI